MIIELNLSSFSLLDLVAPPTLPPFVDVVLPVPTTSVHVVLAVASVDFGSFRPPEKPTIPLLSSCCRFGVLAPTADQNPTPLCDRCSSHHTRPPTTNATVQARPTTHGPYSTIPTEPIYRPTPSFGSYFTRRTNKPDMVSLKLTLSRSASESSVSHKDDNDHEDLDDEDYEEIKRPTALHSHDDVQSSPASSSSSLGLALEDTGTCLSLMFRRARSLTPRLSLSEDVTITAPRRLSSMDSVANAE